MFLKVKKGKYMSFAGSKVAREQALFKVSRERT